MLLFRLEINFHIAESEWLKMPAHVVKMRFNSLEKELKERKFNCPFITDE